MTKSHETVSTTHAILIDDDVLVRLTWARAAKSNQIVLVTFSSVQAFIEVHLTFPKNTPIYIDSDLGNGILGEKEAENLYKLGFIYITLETGYPQEKWKSGTLSKVIQKVIGKDPPWGSV